MRRAILIALSAVLVALLAIGGLAATAQAEASMHNCPQDGQWGTAVWTGADGTSADEALGTCDTVVAAYAFDYRGGTLRWFSERPELNTLLSLNNLDAVIALGGPSIPVVPEPVQTTGPIPEGCTVDDLTMATCSAGDGTYHARTGLHTKPPTITDHWALAAWEQRQMAPVKEFCFYCNGEFLQCIPAPDKGGFGHTYTIGIVLMSGQYEIKPIEHEYIRHYCGRDPEGNYRYCRISSADSIPFNPTCGARWELHPDQPPTCPGYPDAEFGAFRCANPPEGKQYCNFFD